MTNRQRQHLLSYLGLYSGEIDGIWGLQSQRATEAFQNRYMDTVDGIFGQETEKRIRQVIGGAEEAGTFWDKIKYFKREEFRCTCAGRGCNGFPAEPVERLIRNAEEARKHFGAAADVSSGVRCALRNGELPGSAANSLHLRGKAMEFRVRGISAEQLCRYVKNLPEVEEAYAIDDQFVHMGVQKSGKGTRK